MRARNQNHARTRTPGLVIAFTDARKSSPDLHAYAVEWSASAISFYVDDNLYETQTPTTATNRAWEFNQPFFIILNVAVGGNFPGSPSSSTTFPQTMKVDWVRVYEPSDGG
jgi:beta-glucanase (GH16 family)